MGRIRRDISLQSNPQLLGSARAWFMWERRRPLFFNKHIGNSPGLGDLDIADSRRGEVEVAAQTEDGTVGGFGLGGT
jgi:hypothetical protein